MLGKLVHYDWKIARDLDNDAKKNAGTSAHLQLTSIEESSCIYTFIMEPWALGYAKWKASSRCTQSKWRFQKLKFSGTQNHRCVVDALVPFLLNLVRPSIHVRGHWFRISVAKYGRPSVENACPRRRIRHVAPPLMQPWTYSAPGGKQQGGDERELVLPKAQRWETVLFVSNVFSELN